MISSYNEVIVKRGTTVHGSRVFHVDSETHKFYHTPGQGLGWTLWSGHRMDMHQTLKSSSNWAGLAVYYMPFYFWGSNTVVIIAVRQTAGKRLAFFLHLSHMIRCVSHSWVGSCQRKWRRIWRYFLFFPPFQTCCFRIQIPFCENKLKGYLKHVSI